jgi:ubiquitin-conjugating enzyme E2 variant
MTPSVARPLGHRLLEFGALTIFLIYTVGFLGRIALADGIRADGIALFAGLIVGYLFADLISGIAHWLGDRFGNASTPLVGPAFIAPFREHHDDPQAMVKHGVVELVGNTAVFASPPLIAAYYLLDFQSQSYWTLFHAGAILSALIGVVVTNVIHRWAHMEEPPHLARLLQKTGLILSPERHARHHAGAFDRAYCITSGWLDNALDALRVWSRAERILGRKPSA